MLRRLVPSAALAAMLALAAASATTAQSPVPAPESVIGFAPCADYKLATYEVISDYFRRLDAASDRMQLFEIGRTAEGRTQILTVISSEENLRNLAKYKQIARSLALNRDENGRALTDERARQLAREGKAIMWVDFGLHATEVAHSQTAPWMAWKAVTEETEEMKAKFVSTIPIGRFSTPQDIANAALYFASDEANFITGVCMEVDGGRCV